MANTESRIQSAIIKCLEGLGWYVVKISAATKAGIPDVLACDTKGKFWAFEVKDVNGVLSKLQEINIEKIRKTGGHAYVVYSVQQVRDLIRNN